jgi:RimJ/RimL family protein N-acetyltransferase
MTKTRARDETHKPLGPEVDTATASAPKPVILKGRFGRVEKLEDCHAGDLWDLVKGHDEIWTYLPYGPFGDRTEFAAWISQRAKLNDPFSYAVIDARERAVGIATLMQIRPTHRVIEVGHIVYSPALQGRPLGTEAQYLLARYIFDSLGYRRYEWKCNALNARSRAAAFRLGFTFEGVFRQHMIVKARNRDTAWYSMIDGEWPARRRAFERWLAEDNFDKDGRQRVRLADLTHHEEGR